MSYLVGPSTACGGGSPLPVGGVSTACGWGGVSTACGWVGASTHYNGSPLSHGEFSRLWSGLGGEAEGERVRRRRGEESSISINTGVSVQYWSVDHSPVCRPQRVCSAPLCDTFKVMVPSELLLTLNRGNQSHRRLLASPPIFGMQPVLPQVKGDGGEYCWTSFMNCLLHILMSL